jgi:hypothetical protein
MKSWMAIAALGLVVAACGTTEPNRLDLTTPGAHTGAPLPPEAEAPAATTTPEATPEPSQSSDKVTAAEKRIIKGWSDSLRNGHVEKASSYFETPVLISNNEPEKVLTAADEVIEFNSTLPCGAKLVSTRRGSDGFVVGTFKLTERKNAPQPCGTGVGAHASVAFGIQDGHIRAWVRVVEDSQQDPMATPTPTPPPGGTDATPSIS